MQVGTAVDAAVKAEVPRGAKAEGDSVRSELGLAKEAPEPGVRSELKEAMQRPQLQGTGPVGVVRVKSPGKAKLAAATEGGKRWYCRACGKISPAATGPST